MKILTSTYRIIFIEGKWIEGVWFEKFDIFKEISVFGFPLYGKIVNNEPFSSKKDAEDFLKIVENGEKR